MRTEGIASIFSKFQFHKGTIKTSVQRRSRGAAPTFQFHKGTIKTPPDHSIRKSLNDFNSIKVRLKQKEISTRLIVE